MQTNNKLREALMSVKKSIDKMGAASLGGDPEVLLMSLTQVCARLSARIDAALAEPVKNCEVGTPDEQALRFVEFCGKHHTAQGRWICHECPCKGNMNEIPHCLTKWAQMPYEAKEGGNNG